MASLNDIAKKYGVDTRHVREMLETRGIAVINSEDELDFDTENLACALLANEQQLLEGENPEINPDLKPYEPPFDYSVNKSGRLLKGCYIAIIVLIVLSLVAFFVLGETLSRL